MFVDYYFFICVDDPKLTFALGGIGLVVDRGFLKVQVGFQVFGARWPDGCCLGVDRGFLRVDFSF